MCLDSSVFIGEIDGHPVQITVMDKGHSIDEFEYDETENRYKVIYENQKSS